MWDGDVAFQVKVSAKHEKSGESVRREFCVVVKTVVESIYLESAMHCHLRLSFFFLFFQAWYFEKGKIHEAATPFIFISLAIDFFGE